ncbi:DUF998 domain-containing protein [Nocardiopsis coralliicola]
MPAEPTLHGALHDADPVPFYLSLIALVCVLARRFAAEPCGRPWAWYPAATAVAVRVTFAAAALAGAEGGAGAFHGLWQRINLAIGLGWFAAPAYRLCGPTKWTHRRGRDNMAGIIIFYWLESAG